MIVFILACLISFIPYILLFLWLRNLRKDAGEEGTAYQKLCGKSLLRGILAPLPVILLSAISYIVIRLTGVHLSHPLLYEALYTFIVLALMEEIVKYLLFRRALKKTDYSYSWLDVTVLMSIVGIGFGLCEAVIYAIGASIPVVLIRGITVPHAGYGFIVGYFYGKSVKTGRASYKWAGFLLAWFLHGLYDFSLSSEFVALNEFVMLISLLLAVLDIVLVILLIVFARKARKQEKYTQPLRD